MFYEQYTRSKPEAVIVSLHPLEPWTPEAMIDVFHRLLMDGWLDPERMSASLAGHYGTRLGHYGWHALMDLECQAQLKDEA